MVPFLALHAIPFVPFGDELGRGQMHRTCSAERVVVGDLAF